MMGSLFKWELKQTFSSKAFWITGAALVAIPALMLAITLKGEGFTGYEAYLEGLNNYTSFMMFIIGVFAGVHVTGAFEGRKIQAAVMAKFGPQPASLPSFFHIRQQPRCSAPFP